MSTLQNQITQSLDGLSDDSLRFILDMIQRFGTIFVKAVGKEHFERWYGRCLHGKRRYLNLCLG